MFNAPNAATITDRNETMNLSSPNDPLTVTNLPFTGRRQRESGALAAQERGVRRGQRVSGAAYAPGAGAILVLSVG